jgi:hypothetical protein
MVRDVAVDSVPGFLVVLVRAAAADNRGADMPDTRNGHRELPSGSVLTGTP